MSLYTLTKATDRYYPNKFILNKNGYWLLLFSQLANLSLLIYQLVPWMLALISLSLLWRVLLLESAIKRPAKWLVNIFAVVGSIALLLSGAQLGVLLSMVHLLSFAYALKPLELKKRRDLYQLVLIGLFVLASSMLFSQSLYFSLLVILLAVLNFTLLFYFFAVNVSFINSFKGVGKLFIQSVPLAIILFIIFPRIAPFWQVPLANSAKMGLSDKVSAGDIAQLINSTELVFRVNFTDKTPNFNQLYWRALVLEDYDGHSWQKSQKSKVQGQAILAGKQAFVTKSTAIQFQHENLIKYQIIAEPSYQHWLYALAIPKFANNTNNSVKLLPDYTLVNTAIITQTLSYQVNSFIQTPFDLSLSEQSRQQNLSIPLTANPKLVVEAKRLRRSSSSDQELITKVLQHIRQQNYRYTLKPPLLINNSLDQFYFETKAGFCVHYASSFTYLMRAAGIPARLVTGYMGGEYNRSGNYYSIYQFDAHAWSEVWLPKLGWVRVDPTAAVSPERVDKGFSQLELSHQSGFNSNIFNSQYYRSIAWVNFIRQQFDALDYQWTRWVIGYTPERQFTLLKRWFGDYQAWQMAIIASITVALLLVWLWLTNRSKVAKVNYSEWLTLYYKALKLLATKGMVKEKTQSANDFAIQVTQQHKEAGEVFMLLTTNFIRLQYCLINKKAVQKLILQMHKDFKLFKQKLKKR